MHGQRTVIFGVRVSQTEQLVKQLSIKNGDQKIEGGVIVRDNTENRTFFQTKLG